MINEVWLTVDGYDDYFEVSSLGRVRSLDRVIKNSGAYGVPARRKGKIRKQFLNGRGYLSVKLSLNGISASHKVHRLVALAFVPNSSIKPHVNHIDGDKANNSATNLEWVTARENNVHALANGLRKPALGVKNGNAKLTPEIIRQAKALRESGNSCTAIAQIIGVSRGYAWKIVSGKFWNHLLSSEAE